MNNNLPNLRGLLDLQRWNEMRVALTRLNQYTNEYRNEVLNQAVYVDVIDNMPEDILYSLVEGTDDAPNILLGELITGWGRVQSLSKFRLLLAKAVGHDDFGMQRLTAVAFLWKFYLRGDQFYLRGDRDDDPLDHYEQREEELLSVTSVDMLRDKARQGQLQDLHRLWEKTELLLKAGVLGGLDKSIEEMGFIHRLIELQMPFLDSWVVWFVLRMYPGLARSKDIKGRLPLHMAVMCNQEVSLRDDYSPDVRQRLAKLVGGMTLVEIVLPFFPDATEEPGALGRLPLQLLLEGLYEGECTEWTVRSAKALAEANPRTLEQEDNEGMLPAMRAARMKGGKLDLIELIYHILSTNPTVLKSSTSRATLCPPRPKKRTYSELG